ELDAAAVDAARLQELEQLAVAAADVEHARAGLDHVGDQEMIEPRAGVAARGFRHGEIAPLPHQHRRHRFPVRPRARPAPSRKPRTMANSSGSSSRKASWPLSVTISANETRAPPALRACTMARESEVGNSQSEVKEITQKRVGVALNALARMPS